MSLALGQVPYRPLFLRPYPAPPNAFGEASDTNRPLEIFLVAGALLAGLWWLANNVFLVEAYDRDGELVEWHTFFDREEALDELHALQDAGYATELSRFRQRFT